MRLLNDEYLDEAIRCAMCTNPNHTNWGCDGSCRFDSSMYKDIMNTIESFCQRGEYDEFEIRADAVRKFAEWLAKSDYANGYFDTENGFVSIDKVISEYEKEHKE